MELLDSRYWRDAELAGLQFTANRFAKQEIRPHRHGGHSLCVFDVPMQVRTVGGSVCVPAHTLIRIAQRAWHSLRASTTPWSERAIYCSDEVARCVLPAQNASGQTGADSLPSVVVFEQEDAARDFVACHDLLRLAATRGDAQMGSQGRALLRARLWQWIPRSAWSTAGLACEPDPALTDERMYRLYQRIAREFQQRLTLDELAQAVGWHPVHLQKRFKTVWGFTPHDLLVGHRIEYARDLMAGGARVAYAAHAAGFSDQSHLHRTFLGTYAVVPGEYRRLSALDALQPAAARNGIAD